MSELQILGVPQSTFVRTTRIALEEKGVPYTLVPTRPHTPEIDAIHPFGKMPAMRHGDFTLFESRAIIAYADRVFDGPPLLPADAKAAARAEQWASAIASSVFPAVFPYLRENFFPPGGTRNEAVVTVQLPALTQAVEILDRAIGQSGCVALADFSLADMYAIPILSYLRACPESGAAIGKSECLPRYLDRHAKRPSVEKTAPPPMSQMPPRN